VYHVDRPPPPKPLPPPKPPKPEVGDAARLLEHLRKLTPAVGPMPLITLASLAEAANVSESALKKAIKVKAFSEVVDLPVYAPLGTLVVFRDGLGRLASGSPLLERLLADCQQFNVHAFPLNELIAKLKGPLKAGVEAFLKQDDLARVLPAEIAFVTAKGAGKQGPTRLFFRMENLQGRRTVAKTPSETSVPAKPDLRLTTDFAVVFEAAFERIDRERGSYNFVSLVDLRAALPLVSRDVFDAGLQQLRRERKYWLKSAEGFNGLRPEERDAAIPEEGELLLHVSKVRT
jgi:hypothetical protein